MTAKELFGVLLRVLGIWEIMLGIETASRGVYFAEFGWTEMLKFGLAAAAMQFLFGAILLVGADWIVQRAYRNYPEL